MRPFLPDDELIAGELHDELGCRTWTLVLLPKRITSPTFQLSEGVIADVVGHPDDHSTLLKVLFK